MVFQEESFASRWFPSIKKFSPRDSTQSVETSCSEERDLLSFLEAMEKGQVHEFTEDFVRPLRQSNKLHRYRVVRSVDRLQYRLYKDEKDQSFVMYAEVKLEAKEVLFFLYNPDDKDSLYDPERPAFEMAFNPSKTEWMLAHFLDSGNRYSPRLPGQDSTSQKREKEEVAFITHGRVQVGDGVNHCLDADVASRPELDDGNAQGNSIIETDQGRVVDHLITRQAVWNEDLQTLVLDFKGREVTPSAKNFQLASEGRPGRIVCQHGKIAKNTFGLDFRAPLSISQAFAMAISTLFWE